MNGTLEQHNEAFALLSNLNHEDGKLFSRACRGEYDAAGKFVVRFLTDPMTDMTYFNSLALAYEWVEANCQVGAA
jgi:hypothetical protein